MTGADSFQEELVNEFRFTARERIEGVSMAWIELERDPGKTTLGEEILRQLHSLKGEASLLGFVTMRLVAHRTEELVLAAREQGFRTRNAFGDLILAALDALARLIDDRATVRPTPAVSGLLDRIDRALEEEAAVSPESRAGVGVPEEEPPIAGSDAPVADESLRVDAKVVGRISDAASELVIAHHRYEYVLRCLADGLKRARRELSGSGERRDLPEDIDDAVRQLGDLVNEGKSLTRGLDRDAHGLRLQPIHRAFNRFTRGLRSLAYERDRLVAIDIVDSNVMLDKRMLDALAEPIMHLIRNALDHGIESALDRRLAGKSEEGRITLSAEQDRSHLIVRIADNGRGILWAQVERRARDLGLVPAGAALGEDERIRLLFRAGFSTHAAATETSGRGIGLHVVKRRVEMLGGTVQVHSRTGEGTAFELRVPASLALTEVLVVRAGGELFALPASAVDGVIDIGEGEIEAMHGDRLARFRTDRIVLRDLAGVLQLPGLPPQESAPARAVVVRHGGARVAFAVAETRNLLEVVIRRSGALLDPVRLVTGACVLPDGTLSMVLSPAELIASAERAAPGRPTVAPSSPRAPSRILLVEDSALTRAMMVRILEGLGYAVEQASDGEQALRLLGHTRCDLVLTDIEMPAMDGIELTRRLRGESALGAIPIVVLSTRGSDEDQRRAAEAGADAYLVKTRFAGADLRRVLRQRLGQ